MKFDGIDPNTSVVAKRVSEVVEKMQDGEEVSLASEPVPVRERIKAIIAEGELEKAETEKLRRARINALMAAEDPEVAVEGIKLSQKEHGVGNTPAVIQQFNLGEPPERMKKLLEEGEGEKAYD